MAVTPPLWVRAMPMAWRIFIGSRPIRTPTPTAPPTGPVVAVKEVVDSDELMIISTGGQVIRLSLSKVRVMGRATQGVRLIDLDDKDKVCDVARLAAKDEEENGNGNGAAEAGENGQ